tara:strand:- start:12 stop:506 length:495 start_codon:yes stop_codon:yes gene_type:complete
MGRTTHSTSPLYIFESDAQKLVRTEGYTALFDKMTGDFARWGETQAEDPDQAPCPEILDMEIATACDGVPGPQGKASPCHFCYKGNKRQGTQMSLETFKAIFAKLVPVFSVHLEMEDGTQVRLSPEHEVVLSSGVRKRASELDEGDDIMDLRLPSPPTPEAREV